MPFLPFDIVWIWLRGLFAIAILAGGAYLARQWYNDSHVFIPDTVVVADPPRTEPDHARAEVATTTTTTITTPGHREFRPNLGWNPVTGELAAAVALLTWGLLGGLIAKGIARIRLKPGDDEPTTERGGVEVKTLRRPDGTELHIEIYGPPDAPPIVMTPGWGANATEWYYEKKRLAGRFRLITWDLPGLGRSKGPDNNDYSLDKLANDLNAVLELAGGRPALLLGHSIGGMTILTFCRLFHESLRTRVAGLVLVHTTYTNPVRTTQHAEFKTMLEKPVLVPLLHVTIGLWPVVWAMNYLSYLNGSVHRSTAQSAFTGTETQGQLDFAAQFLPHDRPDVLARGMFGMLHYDATSTLATIDVPTLVIAADKDITCKPEASERMAREIPVARLVTLSPGRHMGLIEQNETFDAVVTEFASACLETPHAVGATVV
jgi:pimeloyl-ACP methyl ester carboxylesterase